MGVFEFKKFKEVHKKMERESKKSQRESQKFFRKMLREQKMEQKRQQKRQQKFFSNAPVVPTKNEGLIVISCMSIFSGIISLYTGITMPGDVEMARIIVITGIIFFAVPIALFIIYKSIDDSLPKLNKCEDKSSSMQEKDSINQQELKKNNFEEIKKESNLSESEGGNAVTQTDSTKKRINWNEELFIIELTKTKKGAEVIPVTKEFLEWGKKKSLLKIWWGSGRITGSFYFKLKNVQFLQVNTSLKFSVCIQILKNIAPFDNPNKFGELLNRMKEIFGNFLSNEVRDKGITLPLKTLSGDKLSKFFNVLDWILNNIESKEKKKS